ncbi:tubulin-specific chaperone cofactor E-like protein [Nematostella vectensis]|uniref:tubulin-specific chaperone cofactor E-like protein n=1 Tax=Nematostella vectensis TaxID=45351 RepID=UPI0020771416|nr:tubulin-specific chaperone cofactor E-like protein [Nematostella vectensis]
MDAPPEIGKSLKEALLEKYNDEQFDLDLNYINLSPRREALCKSHVLNFSKRRTISLDNCDVTCAGFPGEIRELCPNVEELDLHTNKISDWREVFSILFQLQRLECLNLSNNPLPTEDTDFTELLTESCPSGVPPVRQLILNDTAVSLATTYKLLDCLPGVQVLFVSLNDYDTIPNTDKTYPSIKHLFMNNHAIQDWAEITNIGRIFPKLEELVMSESPMENISPTGELFPNLHTLKLNKTAIGRWADIDALNTFPSLRDIRLLGIPLIENYSDKEQRQLLIARLPNITKLNGTKVDEEEREDAERFFIRHHMDDTNPPQRYRDLVQQHGVLDKLADVDLDPKTVANVIVRYEEQSPFRVDLDLTQTVKELKKYLSNELGIPSNKMVLLHLDPVGPFGAVEMKYLNNPLYYYKVYDGNELLVHRK